VPYVDYVDPIDRIVLGGVVDVMTRAHVLFLLELKASLLLFSFNAPLVGTDPSGLFFFLDCCIVFPGRAPAPGTF